LLSSTEVFLRTKSKKLKPELKEIVAI